MSAGSAANPEWAIRPGAVRSNAKGERVLVGARQADGRVDVWVWRLGGWHKRRQPQTPERVLKAYPVEGESGLPVPTVSPSPAWVSKLTVTGLETIGRQMANVCFNLSQRPAGAPLTADDLRAMRALHQQWDAAHKVMS